MNAESLDRFVDAQEGVWPAPRDEIAAGHKTGHWIWFVWPQIEGLGRSSTAQYYAIHDLDEATRYLAHPVLGARLIEITQVMLQHRGAAPETILGGIDSMKLRSSATLFEAVPGAPPEFTEILDAFYAGDRCPHTLAAINEE